MQETASLYGLIRRGQSSVDWNDHVTECEAFRGPSQWSFLIFKWFPQILKMPNQRRGYSAKKGAFWIQLIWTHPEPRKKGENTPHMGVHAHINIPIPITHTPTSKTHSLPHGSFPCKQPSSLLPSYHRSDGQQAMFLTHSLTTPRKGAQSYRNATEVPGP